MDVDVEHLPQQSRFEAQVGGEVAYLTYERSDDAVVMTHTVVPSDLEGRGIAGRLARTAVDWARGEGLRIEPQCSYVRGWLAKHA